MIYNIFPIIDATIYEEKEKLNTGIDALLELNKTLDSVLSASGDLTNQAYASRILMKFDYSDLTELQEAGFDTASAANAYKLKLFATEEQGLTSTFTLNVHPLSKQWTNGLGRYDYIPNITDGVSWKYRTGESADVQWQTGSFTAGTTGSYSITPGGGTWYTSSTWMVTKSVNYNDSLDLEIDCTPIISAHLNNTIENDGIIIKKSQADEISILDEMQLKFFSSDTNTIYLPHIRVCWNDWTFNTGSLTGISSGDDNVVFFKNLRDTYTTNDRIKFRISGRSKYPVKTFSTSSNYFVENYLPASSSYSIEDLHTKEIVIPHDFTYTRISCDTTGSYFNFWMNGLQPERWYKYIIKTKFSSSDIRIHDHGFIFKVERPI